MGFVVIGAVCLGTGAVLGTASGGAGDQVTIEVPGALNVSAYCGGEQTHFADGERLSFVPETPDCDLEAPLSAVMPLRGQARFDRGGHYRCDRDAMEIVCARSAK